LAYWYRILLRKAVCQVTVQLLTGRRASEQPRWIMDSDHPFKLETHASLSLSVTIHRGSEKKKKKTHHHFTLFILLSKSLF
jgi:hypothetical protein